jgi:hypothetical protein
MATHRPGDDPTLELIVPAPVAPPPVDDTVPYPPHPPPAPLPPPAWGARQPRGRVDCRISQVQRFSDEG